MRRRRRTINPERNRAYILLSKAGKKSPIWRRMADEIVRPRRSRRVVNLYELSSKTSAREYIIVPGKVLGVGILSHPLYVSAFDFSVSALRKIERAGGKVISIYELVREKPSGDKVRIVI